MMKAYEKIVKERMIKHVDSDLVGGSFRGKSYPHILKDLSSNFIDSSYPEKKCLKGSLTNDNIKYHYAEHLNSSQTMCVAFFKKFFEVVPAVFVSNFYSLTYCFLLVKNFFQNFLSSL